LDNDIFLFWTEIDGLQGDLQRKIAEHRNLQRESQQKNEEINDLKKQLASLQLIHESSKASPDPASAELQELLKQVTSGFLRRDPSHLKIIFDQHHDGKSASIGKGNLHSALSNLGVDVDVERIAELFEEFDSDASGGLDFGEFQQLLHRSNRLFEWGKGLPLHELLADAIPRRAGRDPLRVVSEMTEEEISWVCQAFQEGLSKMLREGSAELKQAFAVSDRRPGTDVDSKFNVVPLSCGRITDFHAGVEERIGT
jgi:hypothetical protein